VVRAGLPARSVRTLDGRRSAIGSGIFQPSTQFFDWLEQWRRAREFEGLTLGGP
jgi:hypothetical protein